MNNKHKLIPKRRFKEFENADAWEQRKLGDITTFNKGKGYSKKDLVESGKPIILYGRLYTDYQTLITKVDTFVKEVENSVISEGWEVIVPASGESAEDISRASVVVESGIILGGDLNIINKSSLLNPLFLALTISNGNQQKEMSKRAQGKSVVHLHNSDLKEINLVFPEIKEQSLIGECFEKLDNLITLHQHKLNKLEEIKSAYLAEMFPIQGEFKPKRRFSDFKEDWNWSTLKEIGNTFTGLSGKTKEDFGHGEAKFITYMNVYSNPISDLNGLENIEIDKKQFQVKYGDVLFTTSSETPEEVGMSSVWLGNEEDVYLNSFCFGFRPSVDIDKYYLAFMLRSVSIRKKFQLLAQGISRYNISKNKVMEMSIPLPCIDEQKKIGLLFKNIEQTIHSQKETVEKLINLKNAYLNEMFV
ncbi:restriction endonuclease subunit S [Granulicatella adiacens]|uniref:restriction endonuclease subunit S n=1 Tax=Granulicatella adiacens TaxID=46124 RepID=UPI004025F6C8